MCLAALVGAFGGFRLRVWDVPVSVTSAPRVFVAGLVLAAIRHYRWRGISLPARVGRGVLAAWRSEDFSTVWPLWFWSRAAVLGAGFLAVATIGFPWPKLPFRVYYNEALNLPARLDTGWYLSIATEGYLWAPGVEAQQNIAFMPGLPLLMRIGGRLIGGHPLLAGQVIVLAASLWAFVYVYRLGRELVGDPGKAAAAVALLACYPFAVFLGAVYTESLFLLAAAGGFYHARRGDVWPTAAFALLAGLVRPNGFLLSVPLAIAVLTPTLLPRWDAWRTWSVGRVATAVRASLPVLAASGAGIVGVLAFSWFIYGLTGRPLAWLESHAAWGRTFTGIADAVVVPYLELERRGAYEFVRGMPVETMNGLGLALALAAIVPVTRRYGLAYGVFMLVNLLPPLLMGGWLSIGRLTVTLFPVFLWLADVVPARHRPLWLMSFAITQGLAAALFYTWRPFL